MKPLILSAYQTMVTKSVMYSVHKIKHFFTLLGNTSCNLPYPFKYVHMYVALFYVYICLSVSCCLSISIYLHLLRVYFYTLFRLCLPACYVCMRTCPHTDIYTYIQSLIFATNNCMKYRCICINIIWLFPNINNISSLLFQRIYFSIISKGYGKI